MNEFFESLHKYFSSLRSYKNLDNCNNQVATFLENIDNSYAYNEILNLKTSVCKATKIIHAKEYVPGLAYFFKEFIPSTLDKNEQATCLKALEVYQSGNVNLLPQQQKALDLYKVNDIYNVWHKC